MGQVLQVNDDELFPADLLCLYTALPDKASLLVHSDLRPYNQSFHSSPARAWYTLIGMIEGLTVYPSLPDSLLNRQLLVSFGLQTCDCQSCMSLSDLFVSDR